MPTAHAPVTITCAYCSVPFRVPYRQRSRVYCSQHCFRMHQKQLAAIRSRTPLARCAYCGDSFKPRHGAEAKRQRYCSRACWVGQVTLDSHVQTCNQCGTRFFVKASLVRAGRGKFCSQACRSKAQRKRAQEKKKPAKPRRSGTLAHPLTTQRVLTAV